MTPQEHLKTLIHLGDFDSQNDFKEINSNKELIEGVERTITISHTNKDYKQTIKVITPKKDSKIYQIENKGVISLYTDSFDE